MFSAKWTEVEIVLLSGMDHTDTNVACFLRLWGLALNSYTYVGCDSGKGPVRRKKRVNGAGNKVRESNRSGEGRGVHSGLRCSLWNINTKLESL